MKRNTRFFGLLTALVILVGLTGVILGQPSSAEAVGLVITNPGFEAVNPPDNNAPPGDDGDDRFLILVPTRVGPKSLQRLVDDWASAA